MPLCLIKTTASFAIFELESHRCGDFSHILRRSTNDVSSSNDSSTVITAKILKPRWKLSTERDFKVGKVSSYVLYLRLKTSSKLSVQKLVPELCGILLPWFCISMAKKRNLPNYITTCTRLELWQFAGSTLYRDNEISHQTLHSYRSYLHLDEITNNYAE